MTHATIKTFFCVLAAAIGMTVAAATQYGVDLHKSGYAIQAFDNGGKGWFMNVAEDCKLMLSTDLSETTAHIIKKWGDLASQANYASLGYFTFRDNQVISMESFTFDAAGHAEALFKSGDQIGFWLTTAEGETLYSMSFVDGKNNKVFNGRDTYGWNKETKQWENRVFMYSDGGLGHAVLPILFGVETVPKASGQPLPGSLAVLLLGSGIVALIRRRHATGR